MARQPYSRFSEDELMLRDFLAIDRTVLANERTFLAYVRTALTLVIAGVTLERLFDSSVTLVAGILFVLAGVGLLAIGGMRYNYMRKIIPMPPRFSNVQSHGDKEHGQDVQNR